MKPGTVHPNPDEMGHKSGEQVREGGLVNPGPKCVEFHCCCLPDKERVWQECDPESTWINSKPRERREEGTRRGVQCDQYDPGSAAGWGQRAPAMSLRAINDVGLQTHSRCTLEPDRGHEKNGRRYAGFSQIRVNVPEHTLF